MIQRSVYLLGVSVCTVDGQIFNWGDCAHKFCLQACSKPITYAMAIEEVGLDAVHKHVGREPSGQDFNNLTLKEVFNVVPTPPSSCSVHFNGNGNLYVL